MGLQPEPLRNAMVGFMIVTLIEASFLKLTANLDNATPRRFLVTSVLKPLVLFYASEKARQAFVSITSISPIISRVLALELLLILSFAAVACHLYSHHQNFSTLSASWLSLFQCA